MYYLGRGAGGCIRENTTVLSNPLIPEEQNKTNSLLGRFHINCCDKKCRVLFYTLGSRTRYLMITFPFVFEFKFINIVE